MSLPVDVQERVLRVFLTLLVLLTIILVGWALKSLYVVLMPVVFALFLAVLLSPVQQAVDKRMPASFQWAGAVVAVLLFLVMLALALGSIWWSMRLFAQKGPEYREIFGDLWQQASLWLIARGIPLPRDLMADGGFREIAGALTVTLRSVAYLIAFVVIVIFLLLLLLLEAREWKRKSLEAFFGARTKSILETSRAVAAKLRRFFYVRTSISFVEAAIEGAWVWMLGIDFAFVWALFFFIMNFVPNVGPIVAAIPPIILAFVQFGLFRAVLTAIGLLIIEQIISNLIDPRIQGRALQMSPVVVVVNVLFWTWAWGLAGTFLAVPITIALMVICSYVPGLQPVAILLSRPGNDELLSRGHSRSD
jgi:AI-2 transport protein TqsA